MKQRLSAAFWSSSSSTLIPSFSAIEAIILRVAIPSIAEGIWQDNLIWWRIFPVVSYPTEWISQRGNFRIPVSGLVTGAKQFCCSCLTASSSSWSVRAFIAALSQGSGARAFVVHSEQKCQSHLLHQPVQYRKHHKRYSHDQHGTFWG